jgi:two-component system, chemotaxis family, protein-glutamate methylesterase/glutaminase
MLRPAELSTTSILFIDPNDTERTVFVEELKRRSPDYRILEATDGKSGLALYRFFQRIDCVVLALELPDCSGFRVLVDLIPISRRPNIAVLMLTNNAQRGLHPIAIQNGAYACFVKPFTSGEDLDRAIQHAIASVGRLPKEDLHGPF